VGEPELTGRRIEVPADPSSAAFPLVAALILPDSDILLTGVGLNPHRIGLIETLREMGAEIEILKPRTQAGEPVGDIRVRASRSTASASRPSARPP
jgi:5-enolpyruvylshikimate-3-phosphate synthase